MSISTLHSFTGIAPDGKEPNASVIYQNGILYGTALRGGNTDRGTLFKYDLTTNSYSTLHSFTGIGTDGYEPYASVIYQNGILYGTTIIGGSSSNRGTLFKYDLSSNSHTTLYSFTGSATDGSNPFASVIYQNRILYGTTRLGGGGSNSGTLFKYDLSSNSYSTLHSFTGSVTDGKYPYASVVYQNDILYGTTTIGGGSNRGTLFSYDLSSNSHTTLYSFTVIGYDPHASIIYQNGILYGAANLGGDNNFGTLFSYDLSLNSYSTLHSFTGTGTDGKYPYASLVYQNDILYGTTRGGGGSNRGTLFSYDLTSNSHTTLYSFTGIGTDGYDPHASVIYQNGILYGTANLGGGDNNFGTLFSYELPIPPIQQPIICNPCPPRALPKPGVAFGGTENIVGFEATQAYRYQSLVSIPFTSRASGSTQIINTPLNQYGYKLPPPPPRNRFG